jgi:hypothetical protein
MTTDFPVISQGIKYTVTVIVNAAKAWVSASLLLLSREAICCGMFI